MSHSLRRVVMALGVVALLPAWALAQEPRLVTGQVTDEATSQPLAGVQVVVEGTTIGTLTDGTGSYSVRVPDGRTTLVFSYLGYGTVEAEVTGATVNVTLGVQPLGLEGIVVTAMGMRREKRDLGYAVQDVSGTELAAVPEPNLVSALTGMAAGVNVTTANTPGGSARIVIRGAGSISGNNQPLFVVDGIPIDNSSYSGMSVDWGNAAADIDPANIQSISVLKGPNAAALYGSRAANGAIIITTKSGLDAGGDAMGLVASTSVTFDTPLRLPDYQNVYGQGLQGRFRYVDGRGGGTFDYVDESWGPKMLCSQDQLIDQFTGPQQPFCPHPDNVRNYFDLGRTVTSNVAISRSTDRANVRLSLSRSDVDGMGPGSLIDKTAVALSGGLDVTERFRVQAGATYFRLNGENRQGVGYTGANPVQQFVWFARQADMHELENYMCKEGQLGCTPGSQYSWNHNYHINPYWSALENGNDDTRDRIFGHLDAEYQLTDWLTVNGRVGRDWYQYGRKSWTAVNTATDPDGGFSQSTRAVSETTLGASLTATRELNPDVTLTLTGGADRRDRVVDGTSVDVAALTVPGIYALSNAASLPDPDDTFAQKRVNALYGQLNINYRNFLNVDLTGRNDWSSTLPEDNNSYFYPSISSAFVFTDAFGLQGDILSSGKIRASWSRVGNDTDPYQLAATYSATSAWNGLARYTVPGELKNANLKPEEVTGIELGTDLGFFNERLGFVLTYYDEKTRNQILGVQVSDASGFSSRVINAGEVRRWGWELQMNANPVRLDNGFSWDVTMNFALPNNEVTELYGGSEAQVIGSDWSLEVQARKGEPYGAFYGTYWVRDDNGNIIVDENGIPMSSAASGEKKVLGNYNPDWIASLQNRFRFGDFDLGILIDTKQGGEVFSVGNGMGLMTGVLEETLIGREESSSAVLNEDGSVAEYVCAPGYVFPGVTEDGQPNTQKICPEDLYRNYWFGITEAWVYDASFIKLREVRLGYQLPESFLRMFGLSSGNVALIGHNLWLSAEAPHIDPETARSAGNMQGVEFGQFPTARSVGFSISIQP